MGQCCLEPDTAHFITKLERFEDLCVVVHLVHPVCNRFRLPEQYSNVVSDDDIEAVNSRRIVYLLIKRSRPDTPGVFDLVIE
jgi:hypothetical protein